MDGAAGETARAQFPWKVRAMFRIALKYGYRIYIQDTSGYISRTVWGTIPHVLPFQAAGEDDGSPAAAQLEADAPAVRGTP